MTEQRISEIIKENTWYDNDTRQRYFDETLPVSECAKAIATEIKPVRALSENDVIDILVKETHKLSPVTYQWEKRIDKEIMYKIAEAIVKLQSKEEVK